MRDKINNFVAWFLALGMLCIASCAEKTPRLDEHAARATALECEPRWDSQWFVVDSLNKEGEYTQALDTLHWLESQIGERLSSTCKIRLLRGLSYSHSLRLELESAHDYLFEAQQIAEFLGEPDLQIQILIDDAEVYRKGYQFQEANRRMEQAEYLIQAHGANASTLAYYHDRDASMYEDRNPNRTFDSMLVAVKRALVYARRSREPYRIASMLNEVGMRHIWVQPDTAMKYWNEAAVIFDTIGADRELALVLINKALVAERDSNAVLFKSYLDSSRALVGTHTWFYESSMIADRMMHYYKIFVPNHDSAFKYLLESRAVTSATLQRNLKDVRVMVKSNAERKDRLLQQNRELREEYEQRQRTFLGLAAALIAAMILLFFWLRKRVAFRKLKTTTEALEDANVQLARNLDEKAVLVSEIHHRVKNNFQLMANLLMQQAHRLGDAQLKAEFHNARLRILSMSTVHDLIYNQRDHGHLQLEDFMRDLVEETLESYLELGEYDLQLHSDVEEVPHTQAIYWGIMLQELVTNSCKYAILPDRELKLEVAILRKGDEVIFKYRDNGAGLEASRNTPGMGSYILDAMVRQFGGKRPTVSSEGIIFEFSYRTS